jgi:hypothetical protein
MGISLQDTSFSLESGSVKEQDVLMDILVNRRISSTIYCVWRQSCRREKFSTVIQNQATVTRKYGLRHEDKF